VNGLPVARLAGIEIRVSITWMLLIAVVTFLGAEQAVLTAPGLARPAHWAIGFAVALAFLATAVAHELAHALVGRRKGLPTTTVMLGFLGGTAPLAIEGERPADELQIAVAGPLVSLAVAGVLLGLGAALGAAGDGLLAISGGLFVVGGLNAVLAGLSLLPGMPLDGGRIIRALAWAGTGDRDRAARITVFVGRAVGWMLVGSGIVLALADMVVGGLLALGLGWMLSTGAKALEGRVRVERLVRGSTVADAIRRDLPVLAPGLSVDTFAERFAGEDAVSALPVVDGDTVLGVVGVRQVRRLPRSRQATQRAADVMVTPPTAPFLAPGDELWPAVELMNRIGVDGLPVVVDGRLEGMVVRESIGALMLRRGADLERGRA
jgi:Zn-dependent protease/CBS domain-containing protein